MVQLKPSPGRRVGRALEALFREARLLERRRRRRYAMLAVLAFGVVAVLAYLFTSARGGSRTTATGRPFSVAVSSVRLPKAGDYFSLAVVRSRLIVSGGAQGSLFPSGSTTSLSHGRASGTCDAATVDPATLKLRNLVRGNCGDPALYGERVLPVSYPVRGPSPSAGVDALAVRIARVDPAAPDGYTLGPVVMTYTLCSDCHVQWIYGDGSLWIYDAYTAGVRGGGELLRVSAMTGTVEQRWVMPQIVRPLLGVDADGFWLAPSNGSGTPDPAHTPPSQLVRYESLYRVTPGDRAPSRVFTIGAGDGAQWLVASGHTVWLDEGHEPSVLWRLAGKNATPTLHGAYPANTNQGGEYGPAAPTYAGNAMIGIYYVSSTGFYSAVSAPQKIIRLSPDTANQQTVAQVPAPPEGNSYAGPPPAVALGRSFYFLDPPTISYPGSNAGPLIQGTGVLYRVTTTT